MKTGDVIAITDSREGMDCAHVGLIVVQNETPHFVHASSTSKRVTFDVSIADYMADSKNSGIMVARPL